MKIGYKVYICVSFSEVYNVHIYHGSAFDLYVEACWPWCSPTTVPSHTKILFVKYVLGMKSTILLQSMQYLSLRSSHHHYASHSSTSINNEASREKLMICFCIDFLLLLYVHKDSDVSFQCLCVFSVWLWMRTWVFSSTCLETWGLKPYGCDRLHSADEIKFLFWYSWFDGPTESRQG